MLRPTVIERLLISRVEGRAAVAVAVARITAGAVFLVFGIAKFAHHASEVESFRTYGLPSPDAFVYAIGVLEIVGGLMLIAGLLTRLAALALAGDMVGAIVVSGIKEGEVISLTLAPALLVVTTTLLWAGPGPGSVDAGLAPARPGGPRSRRRGG
jgi:putative oxidoreductase